MKQFIICISIIILGAMYVSHQKSQVKYIDMPCPICGSDEVLDFGKDINGTQKCHCFECGKEFNF